MEFTQNGVKKKKNPVSGSTLDGNGLLMNEKPERARQDQSELTGSMQYVK